MNDDDLLVARQIAYEFYGQPPMPRLHLNFEAKKDDLLLRLNAITPTPSLMLAAEGDLTIHHHNTTKDTMYTTQQLNRFANDYQSAAAYQQLADDFARYGDDLYENGSVLTWSTNFGNEGGKVYTFAAIKSPIGWTVTGRNSDTVGWALLIARWIDSGVNPEDIFYATAFEAIG